MRYLFDDIVVDVDCRELRRADEPVAVEPQVFDVLVYLIHNRDRVVSKDDLLTSVWRGRVVSDSALNTRINAVRAAIGDNGRDQRLVKTWPRKGFRFQGAVREEPTRPPGSRDRLESSQERADAGVGSRGVTGHKGPSVLRDLTRPPEAPDSAESPSRTAGEGWLVVPVSWLRRSSRATIVMSVCVLVTTTAFIALGGQLLWTPTVLKSVGLCGPLSNELATTIAVMPFTTSTTDPDSRPIAERMGDEVRGYLSRISILRVISREASREIQTTSSSASSTRFKAGLHYTFVGSVHAEDGKLQLSVHLVDARTQLQVWSS